MTEPATFATRESWKTEPLPAVRAPLPFDASYTSDEFERLRRGLIPQQMEDKWFIFFEEPWLYFHRSWTGHAVFGLRIERRDIAYKVVEAWVNLDPQQYHSESVQHDLATLRMLIHFRLHSGGTSPPPKELMDEWRKTLPQQAQKTTPLSWWQKLMRSLFKT